MLHLVPWFHQLLSRELVVFVLVLPFFEFCFASGSTQVLVLNWNDKNYFDFHESTNLISIPLAMPQDSLWKQAKKWAFLCPVTAFSPEVIKIEFTSNSSCIRFVIKWSFVLFSVFRVRVVLLERQELQEPEWGSCGLFVWIRMQCYVDFRIPCCLARDQEEPKAPLEHPASLERR